LALLDQPTHAPSLPITPAQAEHARVTGSWEDDAVLQLVVQDAIKAENFSSTKAWITGWAQSATLFVSPASTICWEGTSVPRANIPFYTVATTVTAVTPQIVNGLFYENPPFIVQAKPGTTADASRAVGEILGFQLEDIKFKRTLRWGIASAALYGTAIWKWGWESYKKKRTIWERSGSNVSIPSGVPGAPDIDIEPDDEDIVSRDIEINVERPFFDHITSPRHVLVDSTLDVPDIREAKFVIHRIYMTYDDLVKMKDQPGWKIPSKAELLQLFMPPRELADPAPQELTAKNPLWDFRAEPRWEDATIDPFNEPLEVLERWDNEKCYVVLQKKLVICNGDNPYGVIPFFSVNFVDVPEAFWGMGLGKLLGAEQRLQQGVTNTSLDNMALNLQGVFTRVRGKSIPTQSIRIAPGRMIDVENKDDIQPLNRTPSIPEAFQHLGLSESRVGQISGVNEMSSQGIAGSSGHSNLARTAAGANLLGAGAGNRPADFVDRLADQVITPFLYNVHEMNRGLLPVKEIKRILNEELQSAYFKNKGDIIELLNAVVKFSILAGAKMSVRRNLAQALPILSSFLQNQFILQQLEGEHKKVDVPELIHMFMEAAEMSDQYYQLIADMSPEEIQRAQANSPAALAQVKLQAAQVQQQQQFAQKQELLDQENTGRAARDVIRHAIETSASPEAIEGEPGSRGFGGE